MRITSISWENYRRLQDGRIDVRGDLVLVGPTDCGKSSILRGVDLVLGRSSAQAFAAVQVRDFTDVGRPLRIEVALADFSDEERSAFPDEIDVEPAGTESLTIAMVAQLDAGDPQSRTVRRGFPTSGHERGPTRIQLQTIGWSFVPAARSITRELGDSPDGALRSLLSGVDLGPDEDPVRAALTALQTSLGNADALRGFCSELAQNLSEAMPFDVTADDLRVVTGAESADDLLDGVGVHITRGADSASLAEQSDGIRALAALTVRELSDRTAKVLAIDEPETHLHPVGQHAIGGILGRSPRQRVVATHSSHVVAQFDPMDVVSVRASGVVSQLPRDARLGQIQTYVRHWSAQFVEPLTAQHVVFVEGPADRILLEALSEISGQVLRRAGAAVVELGGADAFPLAHSVFGPSGFDASLFGLVDADAEERWATALGVRAVDLEAFGVFVSRPDLEGEYVSELGAARVLELLEDSGLFPTSQLEAALGDLSKVSVEGVAAFCRHKKRKILAAVAVASLTAAEAVTLGAGARLLRRLATS